MLSHRTSALTSLLAVVLLMALAFGAVAAPAGPPIKIGGTLALTGPLAATALLHKITAEIYVEELNRNNGLLGRPVEWILLDDQSKPEVTRSLYEKLITVDKVDLLMGPYATGGIIAAMGVAQRYQKLLIHHSFGMPHLAKYDMQFPAAPFGPEPNKTVPGIVFDAVAATATPPKTVAIVTSKFPSAQFQSAGARDVAPQHGLKVVLYLEYEFGTRDFGPIAARIKDANPDLLWVGALGLDGNLVLEELKRLDYTPRRHYHLFPAPGPMAMAPEAKLALSNTFFEEHPPFTNNPAAAKFATLYHERAAKAGVPYTNVDTQAAGSYAAWQMLEAAVTATKSLDDKVLAQWLRKNQVQTIVGRFRFDGPNNYGDDLSKVKQVQDGKWVVVWPKESAAPGARLLPREQRSNALMGEFGIGQGIKRVEDVRLLRGKGRYLDDVNVPGQAHAVILRSVHAHARIRAIDSAVALRAPGVLAVFTGADVEGLGTMSMTLKRKRPDGGPMFARPHRGLSRDRARYVGDPVAMVVAETRAQAEDAADLVQIDYEPLPSVTATADATAPGVAPVWDECPDNISNIFESGDKAATEAAFANAHRIVRRRYVITRVHAQFMEPRGSLGVYDPNDDRYTLYADVQYPHRVRNALATSIFKIPEHKIRVVAGDIGGAFGTKGWQYPEHKLVLWAARKLGRPVRWQCERREAILADEHARDNVSDAELALDAEGRFLGLRVHTLANVGAYVSSDRNLLATFSNVVTLVGVYKFAAAYVHVTSVMTNTNSTAPYRGAGRPEATYVLERLIDDTGRELGLDPVELRRKNLIPLSAMPYKNPLGATYDSGDFTTNMEKGLKLGDVAGFARRRDESRRRGKLRGLALVNPIEQAAGPQPEFAEIRFAPSGSATVLMGSKNQGQGHETTFKQILNERLGLHPADVLYVDGDTDRVAFGMGTMGSRSTVIGGTALWQAADKVITKGKKIAARLLEAAEADVTFADGKFGVVGTDRAVGLKEVARAAFQPNQLPPGVEPGLYETGTFSPKQATWPNGCHVCEVEVDPDSGAVAIVSYVIVDDVGTVINPVTLKGQIHGGVAQGVGQALMEQIVYDRESGQLLTASFMDYAMPRGDTFPDMHIESNPVPTKLNPLGAKGAGEAGTVGALPAVMNAVIDALAPVGVRQLDMPASPERVWQAIQDAKQNGQRSGGAA